MNYELVKKLSDAGFLFRRHYPDQICCEPKEEIDGEMLILPDLNELIEACGDGFQMLDRDEDIGWIAYGYFLENREHMDFVNGSTPEIAVANLWLSLNEKA